MQEKVKQPVLNDKPKNETGTLYREFTIDNFINSLNENFHGQEIESYKGQVEIIFDALFKHSNVKSLREIDKQILKYKNVIKEITNSIDSVHPGIYKHNWSASLIIAYAIAIEDQEFRNTLTLQHEREVLEEIPSKLSFNKWIRQQYESRKV